GGGRGGGGAGGGGGLGGRGGGGGGRGGGVGAAGGRGGGRRPAALLDERGEHVEGVDVRVAIGRGALDRVRQRLLALTGELVVHRVAFLLSQRACLLSKRACWRAVTAGLSSAQVEGPDWEAAAVSAAGTAGPGSSGAR